MSKPWGGHALVAKEMRKATKWQKATCSAVEDSAACSARRSSLQPCVGSEGDEKATKWQKATCSAMEDSTACSARRSSLQPCVAKEGDEKSHQVAEGHMQRGGEQHGLQRAQVQPAAMRW